MTDLHPDLLPYMDHGSFGPCLRHPLVFSVPYFGEAENERLNAQLEAKRERVAKAYAEGDWSKFVFLHERPYRFDALMEAKPKIPEAEYVALLREVWVDTENAWQNKGAWKRELMPLAGKDAWGTLADKPERMTVYRGGERTGISWTLDKAKAEWFASRLGRNHPLWRARIDKAHVVGYLDDRGEEEIVLDPRHLIDCRKVKSGSK